MNIESIDTDLDLENAFKRLEVIYFAEAGTPEFDELNHLTKLIEAYENKHYPIKR